MNIYIYGFAREDGRQYGEYTQSVMQRGMDFNKYETVTKKNTALTMKNNQLSTKIPNLDPWFWPVII